MQVENYQTRGDNVKVEMGFKESRIMTEIQLPAVKRASHSRERSPVHPRAPRPPPQPSHPLTAAGRLGRLCVLPPAGAVGGLAPRQHPHVQRTSSVCSYCDLHRTLKSSVSSCVTVFWCPVFDACSRVLLSRVSEQMVEMLTLEL